MLHERYYVEKEKQEKLLSRKNVKSDFYNGVYDRYEYPVLTREHIPLTWRYDLNPETNPYFMERLGINAVMNSGAIELNGKYYLVARIEGNDRKSFFGVAESDNGIDGFRFWDYPILLPDTCPEETNVYDMRLTKHEDGYIYGVFCSESKDTTVNDLSAAVAAAGIVRTKDLKNWERLPNLVTLNSPQQRNVVLHPEFVDGKYAFYTRPMDDFIETAMSLGAEEMPMSQAAAFTGFDIVVDCLLGTGFSGELKGEMLEAVEQINMTNAYVISADINSGINGDTGVCSTAVNSDLTVSIGSFKTGLFLNDAPYYIGSVTNCDIGISLIEDEYKLIDYSLLHMFEGYGSLVMTAEEFFEKYGYEPSKCNVARCVEEISKKERRTVVVKTDHSAVIADLKYIYFCADYVINN